MFKDLSYSKEVFWTWNNRFLPKIWSNTKDLRPTSEASVKSVNNKSGISQRKRARKFSVSQSTVSRTLKNRTEVKILRRKTAPKYSNDDQERRAQLRSLSVYRLLQPDVQILMDDEKYFSFSGDIASNRSYYTIDPSTAPSHIKFKRRIKFAPKLLVWMAVFLKWISSVYLHRSKTAIDTETYLNECIRKRLIPFIDRYHTGDSILFWPDLANAYYARKVQAFSTAHRINYVKRERNPPNVPQARPIETIWTRLEQRIYENNWEAQNIDQLAKRIILKVKELDHNVVTTMLEGVKKKLLTTYRKGAYSVC